MSALAFPPVLSLRGVTKRFGGTTALRGVSFSVAAGRIHGLVGEDGAGKSTLVQILSGVTAPDAGEMTLDGQYYLPIGPQHARTLGVRTIYQHLALAEDLSVMENILLGNEPSFGPLVRWGRMRHMAAMALEEVGLGYLDPGARTGDLSSAERQLVEIARAVVAGCKILVLDEPASSLARRDVLRLFSLVRRLRDRGIAVIYISHLLHDIYELCEDFTVLRDGEAAGAGLLADVPIERMVGMMVGRDVAELYPRSPRTPGEAVLQIRNLAGREFPIRASLTVHRGEIVGVAGLVGAGRTEMLRVIFGLDPLQSGEIHIGVHDGAATPAERWRQGVGFVSGERRVEGLAPDLSVAENLTLPQLDHLGPPGMVVPTRQEEVSIPWIEAFPIKCQSPSEAVGELSGGNQQKVAIARLLHSRCDLLLLDDPTRGVDVGSKAQIYALANKLALGDPHHGIAAKAILIVSSHLPELMGICDRIAVMSHGILGEARPVAEWTETSLLLAASGQDPSQAPAPSGPPAPSVN